MIIEIGEWLYTQSERAPDNIGVVWIEVTRRLVVDIQGDQAFLSPTQSACFPGHSPPEHEDICWVGSSSGGSAPERLQEVAASYALELDLPDPEVIDELAVREAWHSFVNHRFVNRELGKPAPVPADAQQAYQFHILEWRDGLPAPSQG